MFRELLNAIDQVRALVEGAFRDWNVENMDGCIERLEEAATDCQTLSAQIRAAIAEYETTRGEDDEDNTDAMQRSERLAGG